MEHKTIKLESGGEKYDIEYKRTQSVLYFNDKHRFWITTERIKYYQNKETQAQKKLGD